LKKISAIFFVVSISFASAAIAFSQDTSKTVFAIKPYGGIAMFPSPTLSLPSPIGGLSGSVFINYFEVEFGVSYYRKYDSEKAVNVGTTQVPVYNYRSVSFVQDYINMYGILNIKMTQEKRHIISGYVGFAFRKQLSWRSDTLQNNNSHARNEKIKTKVEPTVGISILGGFRYTYKANKFLNLVTGLDAGISIEEEFSVPDGLTDQEKVEYPKPYEPRFQLGISFGIQFMLSKKMGKYFVPRW
jgi:hypothetical protein